MRRRYETWSRMSVGIPERRERVGGHVEGGRRILIWITKKWRRRMCTGIMWLRVEVRGAVGNTGVNFLFHKRM